MLENRFPERRDADEVRFSFPGERGGEKRYLDLTFLKYNLVFPASGLPADLNRLAGSILKWVGLDPWVWHQLDNFVAAHIALRSNELYLDSNSENPVRGS